MAHLFRHIEDSLFAVPPLYEGRATGFRRADLVGRDDGSVHMGFFLAELRPGGSIDACMHSYLQPVLSRRVPLAKTAAQPWCWATSTMHSGLTVRNWRRPNAPLTQA